MKGSDHFMSRKELEVFAHDTLGVAKDEIHELSYTDLLQLYKSFLSTTII